MIAYGYCHCGCGQKTKIATKTRREAGWIRGQPLRYIEGHYNRKPDTMPDPNPSGLCQCGCGQPAPIATRTNTRLGHVAGRPVSYIVGHHNKVRPIRPPQERFWQKVDQNGPIAPMLGTACWLWTGTRDTHGYGQIRIDGKALKTHRYSYQLHNGPIPAGIDICHHCDNPPCCNPMHLFAGTAKANVADSIKKGRAVMPPSTKGKRSGRASFTDQEIAEFRREFAAMQIGIRRYAELRHVPVSTMWRILQHKLYADVDD